MNYVPAQEIILVWVFVINLHLQLLTRHFMDYDLMYRTHTRTWRLTVGFVWKLAVASCDHDWHEHSQHCKQSSLSDTEQSEMTHDWDVLYTCTTGTIKHFFVPHITLPTWVSLCCQCAWRWTSEGQLSIWHRGRTSQPWPLSRSCPWLLASVPPVGGCVPLPEKEKVGYRSNILLLTMSNYITVAVYLYPYSGFTLGKGERSWATCSPWTRGTTRRLGSTRKEAMASIIMLSDMTLRQRRNGILITGYCRVTCH